MNIRFVSGVALTVMPLALSAGGGGKPDSGKPLNVLFFMADDLRPTLGCYGDPYAVTPHIDRMAARGVVFDRAYCQQAVSNPSRASMLTGLRPDQTGVINLSTHFREKLPEAVTLPQLFRKNGFYTVSTGKIFHPVRRLRDSLSWDAPESVYGTHTYADARNKGGKKRKGRAYERADVPDDIYPDGKIAAEAIAYLEGVAKSGEPFFLAVGFMRPHLPFCAPAKYWDLYAGESFEIRHPERPKGAARLAFHDNNELRGYAGMPKQGPFPPEERQQLTRGYYASVSYIDAQLGKVMDALVRLGLADNTVVVLWGDHGYHLGEQGLWCKSTNFELDTRVPLIVSVPGGKGGHCDAVVETVDIYPTLADYCGVEPPGELAGVSLRPLLEKRGEYRKQYAFSQFVRPYQAINKRVETHMGYSVRTPRWRCTYWYDLKTGEVAEKELYRIGKEGIETQNVSGNRRYAAVERMLASLLDDYRTGKYEKLRSKR